MQDGLLTFCCEACLFCYCSRIFYLKSIPSHQQNLRKNSTICISMKPDRSFIKRDRRQISGALDHFQKVNADAFNASHHNSSIKSTSPLEGNWPIKGIVIGARGWKRSGAGPKVPIFTQVTSGQDQDFMAAYTCNLWPICAISQLWRIGPPPPVLWRIFLAELERFEYK